MPLPMVRNPSRSASSKSYRFSQGSSVEVRSTDIGFQGAWYEATITQTPRLSRRRYSVTYSTLVVEGSNAPLRESVSTTFIRPRPPLEPHSNDVFGLHQLVEAFHNEGWWPGVVSKLPSNGDRLYSVCFPTSREEFEFKASELRKRLEWVKGKWVSVEDSIVDDKEGGHVMFSEGTRVEVSRDRENFGAAWFVGTVVKFIGRTYFLVEYENIKVDAENCTESPLKEIVDLQYIRPCPPMSESTSFNVLDEVEVFCEDGWYFGEVLVILPGSRYIIKYKHKDGDMAVHHTSLRPHLVWTDGHWVHISKDNGKEVADGSDISSRTGKKPGLESGDEFSRPLKMLKKGSLLEELSQLVGEIKSDIRTSRKWKSHACKRSVRLAPVLTSCNNDGEIPNKKAGEPSFEEDSSSQPCTTDGNSLTNYCISLSDKQTDKLAKLQEPLEDSHVLPQTEPLIPRAKLHEHSVFQLPILNSKALLGRGEEIRICADKLAESTELVRTFPLIEDTVHDQSDLILCGSMSDKVPELQMVAVGPTCNGSSLSIVDNFCNESECSPIRLLSKKAFGEVEDSGSILLTKDADGDADHSELITNRSLSERFVVEMEEAPCDTTPTLPLPSNEHIGDDHELVPSVLPPVSSSFVNSIEETVCFISEVGDNGGERENEVIAAHSRKDTALHDRVNIEDSETALIDPSPMESSSKKMILSLSKISEMSELVESALNILPQQPHFRPLLKHGEELREGLACGLMMTFASLVTGLSNLRILDSEQDFEEKLRVLDYLEKHGFNIQPVRARLEKLLEIRNMFGQLEEKKNSMGTQVQQLEEAKGKDNLFLSKLEKSVVELEERLACIQEERSSVILKIKKNESEIVNLKAGVRAAEEKTVSTEREFVASVTAPW